MRPGLGAQAGRYVPSSRHEGAERPVPFTWRSYRFLSTHPFSPASPSGKGTHRFGMRNKYCEPNIPETISSGDKNNHDKNNNFLSFFITNVSYYQAPGHGAIGFSSTSSHPYEMGTVGMFLLR